MKIFTNVIAASSVILSGTEWSRRISVGVLFATLCLFVACDSGSSSADPDPIAEVSSSSGDDAISSSSVTDKGKSSGGSSKSSSSVKSGDDSQKSSSSVNGGSCSSTEVESSSDSKKRKCEENAVDVDTSGYMVFTYQCKNGEWKTIDIYEIPQATSSDAHYDMTEQFYCDGSPECEESADDFTDPRDNQVYKTINVYTQDADRKTIVAYRVFAENLNYGQQIKKNVVNSDENLVEKYCYNDDEWYCDNGFGGLYTWSEAMGLPKACDTLYVDSSAACKDAFVPPDGRAEKLGWYVHRQGICPDGWHVMNYVEWLKLSRVSGSALKSSIAWSDWGGNNYYGFSALPVGYLKDGEYVLFGKFAFFWEPDEYDDVGAKSREIVGKNHDEANVRKDYAASVRCVEDYEDSLWE